MMLRWLVVAVALVYVWLPEAPAQELVGTLDNEGEDCNNYVVKEFLRVIRCLELR